MSGIYISGLQMPKGCATCPYCDRAWNKPKCKAKSMQGRFMEQRLNLDRTRQKWCPLIPVPDHGRLVDADKIHFTGEYGGIRVATKSLIDAMPTVIPADESDMDSFIRIFEENYEEDGMDSFIRILKD